MPNDSNRVQHPDRTALHSSKFETEVDSMGESEWHEAMQQFDDASIYQTWSYGLVHAGEGNLSHIVLKKDGVPLAMALARLKTIFGLGAGIAYVYWGPVWRKKGQEKRPEILEKMLEAMRQEYVIRRGLLLRILPRESALEGNNVTDIFKEGGFELEPKIRPYTTYLMNLNRSEEDLFKNLKKNWRHRLRQGRKHNFQFVYGTESGLYEIFISLYKDMYSRKRFARFVDVHDFQKVQEYLPKQLKMQILLCYYQDKPIAGAVWSNIGNTVLSIFSATTLDARDRQAMYCLKWEELLRSKEEGLDYFDLGGVDAVRAPGPTAFKAGLAGKDSQETHFIGRFSSCESLSSSILVNGAEKLRMGYRNSKLLMERFRQKQHQG